jgi:hypothetical protein
MQSTLLLFEALQSAPISPDKARAVVDSIEDEMISTFASKNHLESVKADLMSAITLVSRDLSHAIEKQFLKLTIALGGIAIACTAVLFALLRVGH